MRDPIYAVRTLCTVALLLRCVISIAQDTRSYAPPTDTAHRQAEQIDHLREQLAPPIDALSARPPHATDRLSLPAEADCFAIHTIEWRHAEAFPWLPREAAVEHACIGPQGLRALRDWVTRRLIARGYVTSVAVIPEQDLSGGRLVVEVVPGRIGTIRDAGGRIGWPAPLFPRHAHGLLNVRDLDQALENVRRLPGQAATAFDLLPGAALGDTDIVVRHPADARRVRVLATADNAGLDATGRNQLGAIVAVDSPLHLYDQLVLTYNTDAARGKKPLGSQAKSAAWNVPIGYASVSVGISEWTSRRTLPATAGGEAALSLAQRTRRYEAALRVVPYRTSHGKTTLRFTLSRRDDRSRLGSTELDVNRRDIVGYDVGIAHREKLADGALDAGFGMRGSIPALSAHPGRVNDRPAWDGRYRLFTATLAADARFRVGARRFGYRGTLRVQHAPGAVPSTEFLQIGGRYTVRGFDGNQTLAGANGWIWRNELATGAFGANEIYAALDAGRVSGAGAAEGAGRGGRTLVGTSVGVRGGYRLVGYDVALGAPLYKPALLNTAAVALDVSLTARF
ncbi:TPA: ShlB/FhaC/HecB family hemolysin secretion/activation protein [Burkholderia multivorans]|uniref:ShlB/FhaC/HecB family hemolysin secretion/activation protein n=1 Tax=Burkholderia multivorans TaxID=87883 RepID=UPI001C220198|nr:ShlB/FhaC/HecB family hemolysin secretion/activation protein [Burkholderia multivorans]MBU9352347.1 ShlB/FhaC/HecB family hemolysin secretion/activation protein [Burkholderia multivorans]MBU9396196.1 ShlB/FhaC/HecB family hemolysin secretion/activation protein [Burkholderia multivorans]HDR9837110.1 ShlB/FhaC/HecB family hemolysin secretion/activation protein [Burkholderia multivorans]HDR9841237.1 ShlB/FhaC/HecB family hemolysin secretion/activation protein [Burkholderia multivorans]HDR98481